MLVKPTMSEKKMVTCHREKAGVKLRPAGSGCCSGSEIFSIILLQFISYLWFCEFLALDERLKVKRFVSRDQQTSSRCESFYLSLLLPTHPEEPPFHSLHWLSYF